MRAAAMTESEFNAAVDVTLIAIEDAVEELDTDIDMENSGGILTLTCPNGSKIIINRQGPTQEIWVAARSGGYHCGWKENNWVCNTTQEALFHLLSRVLSEQTGTVMNLEQ
jgi:CyaY protein